MKPEQISILPMLSDDEDVEDILRQVESFREYEKKKRNWENAFQKWCNYMAYGEGSIDGSGCCGFSSICDWCEDNSYGRPCVRALNLMLRDKCKTIDYDDYDFRKVWNL